MATADLGGLKVQIGADVTPLEQGESKAQEILDRLPGQVVVPVNADTQQAEKKIEAIDKKEPVVDVKVDPKIDTAKLDQAEKSTQTIVDRIRQKFTQLAAFRPQLSFDTSMIERAASVVTSVTSRIMGALAKVVAAARIAAIAVGTAFVAAVGLATAAIVAMGKGLIDNAEKMGRLAQQVGMTTEQFSRWNYMAGLSKITTEELVVGLQGLSRAMQDSLTNSTGTAARTLAAMNISLRDSRGELKSQQQILEEVADKFATYVDDANKSALAMNLFGEAGTRMIPILNQGSEGIKRMAAESDSLGTTISTRTAVAAKEFTQKLFQVIEAFKGVGLQIVSGVLPALTSLAESILTMIRESTAFEVVMWAVDKVLKTVASTILVAVSAVDLLVGGLITAAETLSKMATLDFSGAWSALTAETDRARGVTQRLLDTLNQVWGAGTQSLVAEGAANMAKSHAPVIASTKELADLEAYRNKLLQEGAALTVAMRTPQEDLAAYISRLNLMLHEGVIGWETYQRAMRETTIFGKKNMNDLASGISSALTTIFSESKTAAIAAAIINTAQSISKTFAEYGATPMGFAMGALAAATGAAQIAAIRRTTKSGGGSAPRVSSSSGSVSRSSSSGTTTSNPGAVLQIQTIGSGDLITKEVFRDLMERIVEWQRDGGSVVLQPT